MRAAVSTFFNNKFASITVSTALLITLLSACQSDHATLETAIRTFQISGHGITVYAAGDIADCKRRRPEDSDAAKTASLIVQGLATNKDAVVLSLGDHTYPIGLIDEFHDCYEPTGANSRKKPIPHRAIMSTTHR